MTQFINMSNEERDRYNLPPGGFQGNEFTVVLQAPTALALKQKLTNFHKFALAEGYENFAVLSEGPDPDGGFKAIATAHNFNPVTWASEQFHRAKIGAQTGWQQGKKKAVIKSHISQQAELAAAAAREMTLQKARIARIQGAAPIRIQTEAEVGAGLEELRRQKQLAAIRARSVHSTHAQPVDIFGTEMP